MLPEKIHVPVELTATAATILGMWQGTEEPLLLNKKLKVILGGNTAYKLINGTFHESDIDHLKLYIVTDDQTDDQQLKTYARIIYNKWTNQKHSLKKHPVLFGKPETISNGDFLIDSITGAITNRNELINADQFLNDNLIRTERLKDIIENAKKDFNSASNESSDAIDKLYYLLIEYYLWITRGKRLSPEISEIITSETSIHTYLNPIREFAIILSMANLSLDLYKKESELNQIKDTNQDNEALKTELAKVKAELKSLETKSQNEIASLKQQLNAKDVIYGMFKAQLNNEKLIVENKLNDLKESHQKKYSDLTTKNQALQDKIASISTESESQAHYLNLRIAALEGASHIVQEKAEIKLNKITEDYNNTLSTLREQNESLRKVITSQSTEIETFKKTQQTHEKKAKELEKQIQDLKSTLVGSKKELATATTQLKDKTAELTKSNNKTNEALKKCAELEAKNNEMSTKLKSMTNANNKTASSTPKKTNVSTKNIQPTSTPEPAPKTLPKVDNVKFAAGSYMIEMLASDKPWEIPPFTEKAHLYVGNDNHFDHLFPKVADMDDAQIYFSTLKPILKTAILYEGEFNFDNFIVCIDNILYPTLISSHKYIDGKDRLELYSNMMNDLARIANTIAKNIKSSNLNKINEIQGQIVTNTKFNQTDLIKNLTVTGKLIQHMQENRSIIIEMHKELGISNSSPEVPIDILSKNLNEKQFAFYQNLLKISDQDDLINNAFTQFREILAQSGTSYTQNEINTVKSAYGIRNMFNLFNIAWSSQIDKYFDAMDTLSKKRIAKDEIKSEKNKQVTCTLEAIYHNIQEILPNRALKMIINVHQIKCIEWSMKNNNKHRKINEDDLLFTQATSIFTKLYNNSHLEMNAKKVPSTLKQPNDLSSKDPFFIRKIMFMYLITTLKWAMKSEFDFLQAPSLGEGMKALADALNDSNNPFKILDEYTSIFPAEIESLKLNELNHLATIYVLCIAFIYHMDPSTPIEISTISHMLHMDNLPNMPNKSLGYEKRFQQALSYLKSVSAFLSHEQALKPLNINKESTLSSLPKKLLDELDDIEFQTRALSKFTLTGEVCKLLIDNSDYFTHTINICSLPESTVYLDKKLLAMYVKILTLLKPKFSNSSNSEIKNSDVYEFFMAQNFYIAYYQRNNLTSTISHEHIIAGFKLLHKGVDDYLSESKKNTIIPNDLISIHQRFPEFLELSLNLSQLKKQRNTQSQSEITPVELLTQYLIQTIQTYSNDANATMPPLAKIINDLIKDTIHSKRNEETKQFFELAKSTLISPESIEEANLISFAYSAVLKSIIHLSKIDDETAFKEELIKRVEGLDNTVLMKQEQLSLPGIARIKNITKHFKDIEQFLTKPAGEAQKANDKLCNTAKKISAMLMNDAFRKELLRSFLTVGDTHRFLLLNYHNIVMAKNLKSLQKLLPITGEHPFSQYNALIARLETQMKITDVKLLTDKVHHYFSQTSVAIYTQAANEAEFWKQFINQEIKFEQSTSSTATQQPLRMTGQNPSSQRPSSPTGISHAKQ